MEWAGRLQLLHYVAEASPPLETTALDTHQSLLSWDHDEVNRHPFDDGHLVKNIRALAWGEQFMSKKYDPTKHIMKPETWLRLANLGKILVY